MVNNKVFWGIVTAAAAGAVIGLLFATDEGTQVRKKIKKKTNSLAGELIDALEKSREKASDLKAKGEQYKDDLTAKAGNVADDVSDEFHKM